MSITKVIQLTMTRCELDQSRFPGMYVEAIPDRDTPGAVELYLCYIGDQFDTRNFMYGFVPNEERTIESEIESTIDYYAEELAKELDANDMLPDNLSHLLSDDECDSDECDCNEGDSDCDCADCNSGYDTQGPANNTCEFDNIPKAVNAYCLHFELNQQKFPGLFVDVVPCYKNADESDVFLRHEGAEPFYMFTVQTKVIEEIAAMIDARIDECVAKFREQFPETTDERIIVYIQYECPVCGNCYPHSCSAGDKSDKQDDDAALPNED